MHKDDLSALLNIKHISSSAASGREAHRESNNGMSPWTSRSWYRQTNASKATPRKLVRGEEERPWTSLKTLIPTSHEWIKGEHTVQTTEVAHTLNFSISRWRCVALDYSWKWEGGGAGIFNQSFEHSHGLLARFSQLFSSFASAPNGVSCSATAPRSSHCTELTKLFWFELSLMYWLGRKHGNAFVANCCRAQQRLRGETLSLWGTTC